MLLLSLPLLLLLVLLFLLIHGRVVSTTKLLEPLPPTPLSTEPRDKTRDKARIDHPSCEV